MPLFRSKAKITGETVQADFNDIHAVMHYTRAAHFLGLWESERTLIRRHFPDPAASLLEAGCGAGRATIGLWHEGYRRVTAFDFATEMIEQAQSLAEQQGISGLPFMHADATRLVDDPRFPQESFDGALFLFNGMMQIPGRENRRAALRGLRSRCRPGARLIFTTHDRDSDPIERAAWVRETILWERGEQDPRLLEFGDRYFSHEHGQTFMHLPDRAEILADLAATGWAHVEDALRNELAHESEAVRDFSDNCRFWVASSAE